MPPEIANSALGTVPEKESMIPPGDVVENGPTATTDAAGLEYLESGESAELSDVAEEVVSDQTTPTPKKPVKESKIFVWVPLTFPDVPQKGDWDIGRLKDSVYFFS